MEDLLTTKQVIDLLQIDRTTVYRMLNDGRLAGVKIGNQWRFHKDKVVELISGKLDLPQEEVKPTEILPLHCLQPIQDVFADIAEVGALTTDTSGEPISDISNSCEFCSMILSSEKGKKGCVASWKKLADTSRDKPEFFTCHAGLQYLGAKVEVEDELIAMICSGQVYTDKPDKYEETRRISSLAGKYDIDMEKLTEASKKIKVIEKRNKKQLGDWLLKVSTTFERIGLERKRFVKKLQKISNLSSLEE
ncbi:PocR ligand-binding domain-containing protein [candidate division KSB1 bacterium]